MSIPKKCNLVLLKKNTDVEAVARRCSVKKVFLTISQNSQENTCARDSLLIKLQAVAHVFSCEFCKIFKKTFFKEHFRWLLKFLVKQRAIWCCKVHVVQVLMLQSCFNFVSVSNLHAKCYSRNLYILITFLYQAKKRNYKIFLKTFTPFYSNF